MIYLLTDPKMICEEKNVHVVRKFAYIMSTIKLLKLYE